MSAVVSLFRAVQNCRVARRDPKIGDLVRVADIWGYQLVDDGFSHVGMWFPKIPRKGTGVLTAETATHWTLRFWCREIALAKAAGTVRPLNRFGRLTARDRIGQAWMARQIAGAMPPDDDPALPPAPHRPGVLLRHLAVARGGLDTVHALGGRYHSWPRILLRRWLTDVCRRLAGAPQQDAFHSHGVLVSDCRAILILTYRGQPRRMRLDQVRRHYNGNIHLLGRLLPGGERRTFSMVNATVTAVEGYGPVTDSRLFLDLRSLDRNAAQHHADWFGQGKPDPGFQVPAPTMVTRVVGKVWERLTRPYWAYIHWRYPKLRGFPKPTLRERLQRAALPLRHVVAAVQYRLRWVRLEYGHHQPPRRDVAQMGARWRVRLRAAADQIEAGTPPDIRELRHLAKLAKEPVLGRRIARHIVRTARAELPRHHPQRHVLTAALAVSPPRRRVIPLHEKQKAWALAGWAFDHRSIRRLSGARAHDIGPPLLAFVYLHAVYGWPYWCRVAGFDRQGLNRECLRALLLVHLGQPDKGRWVFSATAAERMRKIAALRC